MNTFKRIRTFCNLVALYLVFVLPFFAVVDLRAAERLNEIIAFGDSITQGAWEVVDPPKGGRVGGYEPDLEALTDARNDHFNVYNFGVAGETTLEGDARFNLIMSLYPDAKYVFILEGTNDLWSSISRADTVWLLSAMVDKARAWGIIPILGTLTPDLRLAGQTKNVPLYNALIKAMAADKNVVVADSYDAMIDDWKAKYVSSDGLHPSRAGYAKMAEIWFATTFACSIEYLDQCFAVTECLEAGGYWYGEFCNTFPPPLNGPYLLLRP